MTWSRNKSVIIRRMLAASAAISFGVAGSAHAAILTDMANQTGACLEDANSFAAQPAAGPIQIGMPYSKSSAILGGQPSALEQISLAQEAGVASGVSLVAAEPVQALAPAVGGLRVPSIVCLSTASFQPGVVMGSDDFLASRRLEVGHTAFDRDWRRVRGDRISANKFHKLVGDTSGFAAIGQVNSWVNQAIAYTEDRELFSRADFWAGAATTLRLRRGDCEDIALTKMQLLAAAGIPREDMILTIARDLVRNADHAVLIVRHDGHYYMLDNASDEVFDATGSHDYRPILSFGSSQTWLHGY